MKIAIFTGPRVISAQDEQLVRSVVRDIYARGYSIYVGDANGVDGVVRNTVAPVVASPATRYESMHVFYPRDDLGRTPAGLAERSTRMVKEALRAAGNDKLLCVGFPNKPCPAEIMPGRSWKSSGSGTWSTLALAIGHEIETILFPLTMGFSLPWGGWERYNMKVADGWRFTPAPSLL